MKVGEIYNRLKIIESLHEKILSVIVNKTSIDKALSFSNLLELKNILATDIYELKEREIKNA